MFRIFPLIMIQITFFKCTEHTTYGYFRVNNLDARMKKCYSALKLLWPGIFVYFSLQWHHYHRWKWLTTDWLLSRDWIMFAVRKSTGPPRLYTSPRIPYRRQSFVKFFLKKLPLIVFEWQSMQELKEKKRKKKRRKRRRRKRKSRESNIDIF